MTPKILFICFGLVLSTLAHGQNNQLYKQNLEQAKKAYQENVLDKIRIEEINSYDDDFIQKVKLAEYYAYSQDERNEDQMRKFLAVVKKDKSFLDKEQKTFSFVETEYAKLIMQIELTLHKEKIELK